LEVVRQLGPEAWLGLRRATGAARLAVTTSLLETRAAESVENQSLRRRSPLVGGLLCIAGEMPRRLEALTSRKEIGVVQHVEITSLLGTPLAESAGKHAQAVEELHPRQLLMEAGCLHDQVFKMASRMAIGAVHLVAIISLHEIPAAESVENPSLTTGRLLNPLPAVLLVHQLVGDT